jgi:hypothetical protein
MAKDRFILMQDDLIDRWREEIRKILKVVKRVVDEKTLSLKALGSLPSWAGY